MQVVKFIDVSVRRLPKPVCSLTVRDLRYISEIENRLSVSKES